MPIIKLQKFISAPVERVFDLSRSIDLHRLAFIHTKEEAVAGVTSGLIGLHQTVTWRATHFGLRQHLTVKIDRFEPPHFFSDVMLKGAFKKFRHEHMFETTGEGCTMCDLFDYESRLGFIGRLVDHLFLERYMKELLEIRNVAIKKVAESDEWRKLLPA